ncbi:hypothetical protein, partial [Burkholderia ubonensis]|uniref:hypothetical protein n=1 Tax=Burkholderia ubonensis TaxID=101571 RepID=UPI0015C8BB04
MVDSKVGLTDTATRNTSSSKSAPPSPVILDEPKIAAGHAIKKPSLVPAKGPTTYQRTIYKDPQDDERSTRTQARIDEDADHAPEVPVVAPRTSVDDCLPLIKRMAKKLG